MAVALKLVIFQVSRLSKAQALSRAVESSLMECIDAPWGNPHGYIIKPRWIHLNNVKPCYLLLVIFLSSNTTQPIYLKTIE